jgi:translation initiation factor 3 subunit L
LVKNTAINNILNFCRARGGKKTTDEIETLNQNKMWNVFCVLNVLHSLVDKSNIKKQLEVYASGGDPDSVAGDFGRHSLYKMLGYFSLVGLLRLHSLLGDYYQAIKVLENMEIHKKVCSLGDFQNRRLI